LYYLGVASFWYINLLIYNVQSELLTAVLLKMQIFQEVSMAYHSWWIESSSYVHRE